MSTRPLSRVSSIRKANVLEKLVDAGISDTREFLSTDVNALMNITGLSLADVKALVYEVSDILCPSKSSALDMYKQMSATKQKPIVNNTRFMVWDANYIQSGWASLDAALGGGLPSGTLTEVSGIEGSGKTQLCLQLCACTLLCTEAARISTACSNTGSSNPGASTGMTSGSVAYFDLELRGSALAKRLQEMLHFYWSSVYGQGDLAPNRAEELSSLVMLQTPKSCAELQTAVGELQALVVGSGVKLVVIDNLSSLVQKDNLKRDSYLDEYLIGLIASLKTVAEECSCTVVITNSIKADAAVDVAAAADASAKDISFQLIHRPLGMAFKQSMSFRMILCGLHGTVGSGGKGQQYLVLEKSTNTQSFATKYRISTAGLTSV